MFTGIVQAIGTVRSKRRRSTGISFWVESRELSVVISPGDSIAINGVCQTVEGLEGTVFSFTSVGETLKGTTLSRLLPGGRVNLELAAKREAALGGHFVLGHVDGIGEVVSFSKRAEDRILSIRLPEEAFRFVVPKGSIAVDGVSLTVAERSAGTVVKMSIIPFTLENTIIRNYRVGTLVNIEADILGKFVMDYLDRFFGGKASSQSKPQRERTGGEEVKR